MMDAIRTTLKYTTPVQKAQNPMNVTVQVDLVAFTAKAGGIEARADAQDLMLWL